MYSTICDNSVRSSQEAVGSGPGDHATIEKPYTRPRSLSATPSHTASIPDPLLVGIAIGVAGTLFILGLAYAFRYLYRQKERSSKPIPSASIPLRPSAPREFRHLEHFTTSQVGLLSPTSTTASSLRVARRRPDGGWEFTDALYSRNCDEEPDPVLPPSHVVYSASCVISPTSPDSSGTAFSCDDASSSKTGPPPYAWPIPPPSPRYKDEKLRGLPSRR